MNTVVLILKNLLPMSRRAVYRDNKLILDLLHAQTEFMMLNRHDIMSLAATISKSGKKNVSYVPKTNSTPNMYG